MLPLVPPETEYWSPYSGLDALCGNPLVIDIEDLITRGLLDAADRPAEVLWTLQTEGFACEALCVCLTRVIQ